MSTFDDVVELVLDGLVQGHPAPSLLDAAATAGHDPAFVLAEVLERLSQRASTSDPRLALHLERRREIFRRAMEFPQAPHLAVALRALQDLAKLEGYYDAPADDDDAVDGLPFGTVPTTQDLMTN